MSGPVSELYWDVRVFTARVFFTVDAGIPVQLPQIAASFPVSSLFLFLLLDLLLLLPLFLLLLLPPPAWAGPRPPPPW
jgi:hypothetical protein